MWQAIASARERDAHPPPGRLIDVGGHRLHLHCTGTGVPTVVLEAGLAAFSSAWAWVQPAVAERTRACSYDRAGLAWSEPGPGPRDAERVAAELHALLGNAGEAPPFVLAGHSLGGIYQRMFAHRFPGHVAGLVFVDSSHPEQFSRMPRVEESSGRPFGLLPWLARLGVLRAIVPFMLDDVDFPEPALSQSIAFYVGSELWVATNEEFRSIGASMSQVRATDDLSRWPIAVLSATEIEHAERRAVLHELHRELAALSPRGRHELVEGADHVSIVADPEHAKVVADAILEVAERISRAP